VRILGQIADKANLLGVAAKKKSVEDEKTKLNETIKSFCNDALAFLAELPEVETEKGLRQAVTIQQAHRLKMRADYKDIGSTRSQLRRAVGNATGSRIYQALRTGSIKSKRSWLERDSSAFVVRLA
jgi:hypothetical protein